MSILIKGMEMPTSCDDCRFCGGTADTDCGPCAWCDVDGKARVAGTRQDCPLVPVPKHGRLIDADALDAGLKEMSEIEWNQKAFPVSWAYAFDAFRGIIERDEPTILEAEKGE